jgi:hypothetical protein
MQACSQTIRGSKNWRAIDIQSLAISDPNTQG